MKLINKSIANVLFLSSVFLANAENGLDINFLGNCNSHVRITGEKNMYSFPFKILKRTQKSTLSLMVIFMKPFMPNCPSLKQTFMYHTKLRHLRVKT